MMGGQEGQGLAPEGASYGWPDSEGRGIPGIHEGGKPWFDPTVIGGATPEMWAKWMNEWGEHAPGTNVVGQASGFRDIIPADATPEDREEAWKKLLQGSATGARDLMGLFGDKITRDLEATEDTSSAQTQLEAFQKQYGVGGEANEEDMAKILGPLTGSGGARKALEDLIRGYRLDDKGEPITDDKGEIIPHAMPGSAQMTEAIDALLTGAGARRWGPGQTRTTDPIDRHFEGSNVDLVEAQLRKLLLGPGEGGFAPEGTPELEARTVERLGAGRRESEAAGNYLQNLLGPLSPAAEGFAQFQKPSERAERLGEDAFRRQLREGARGEQVTEEMSEAARRLLGGATRGLEETADTGIARELARRLGETQGDVPIVLPGEVRVPGQIGSATRSAITQLQGPGTEAAQAAEAARQLLGGAAEPTEMATRLATTMAQGAPGTASEAAKFARQLQEEGLPEGVADFARGQMQRGIGSEAARAFKEETYDPLREGLLESLASRGILDSSDRIRAERELLNRGFANQLALQDRAARERGAELALAGGAQAQAGTLGAIQSLLGAGGQQLGGQQAALQGFLGAGGQATGRQQAGIQSLLGVGGQQAGREATAIQGLLGAGGQEGTLSRANQGAQLQAQMANQQAALRGLGLEQAGMQAGAGMFQGLGQAGVGMQQQDIANQLAQLQAGAGLGDLAGVGAQRGLAGMGGLSQEQLAQSISRFQVPNQLRMQAAALAGEREQAAFGQGADAFTDRARFQQGLMEQAARTSQQRQEQLLAERRAGITGAQDTATQIRELLGQGVGEEAAGREAALTRLQAQLDITRDPRDFAQTTSERSLQQAIDLIGRQLNFETGRFGQETQQEIAERGAMGDFWANVSGVAGAAVPTLLEKLLGLGAKEPTR